MKPKWIKLLEEQRRGGHLGLTVPFLVGALREPSGSQLGGEPKSELRSLLASMMDNHYSLVRIYECQDLIQPTVMLEETWGAEAVISMHGSPSQLYAWPKYFLTDKRDIESLSQGLWKLLKDNIRMRRFSYKSSSYRAFDKDDLDFIKLAFSRPDENEE